MDVATQSDAEVSGTGDTGRFHLRLSGRPFNPLKACVKLKLCEYPHNRRFSGPPAFSALAIPPVPRKAPEFTIVEPSGKPTLLSSYKGKVVCVEFLYTTCPHCQAASQVFSKMQRGIGPTRRAIHRHRV